MVFPDQEKNWILWIIQVANLQIKPTFWYKYVLIPLDLSIQLTIYLVWDLLFMVNLNQDLAFHTVGKVLVVPRHSYFRLKYTSSPHPSKFTLDHCIYLPNNEALHF